MKRNTTEQPVHRPDQHARRESRRAARNNKQRDMNMPNSDEGDPETPPFFTEKEVAWRWNMSVKKVQAWRVHGGGPDYHKFGTLVRYSEADLVKFEASCARSHTSDSS
ncbi:hypothetical protein P2H44_07540 [Albimonas sp. CAU 1670]|uniref:hypothetical protein n=1 Tax=Albimonas sp. CAU 1670 TaxID=3032599 RepID=UPI0023DA2E95|nr:hypothetical protein [Albimonas sp. CAU 1670]MDF2232405.1 hypothetical protein [Albimonas sp. CAU 1670]